jgi:hypothetical protein
MGAGLGKYTGYTDPIFDRRAKAYFLRNRSLVTRKNVGVFFSFKRYCRSGFLFITGLVRCQSFPLKFVKRY